MGGFRNTTPLAAPCQWWVAPSVLPLYRQKGYPLTSSIMESTVKQVSRRIKGTEKFWSSEGGEAVLQLRGDYLSDSEPMDAHWRRATTNANGFRAYGVSA